MPDSFVRSFDGFGDHIYILRLDDSFEVVLENLCEVVYISLALALLVLEG